MENVYKGTQKIDFLRTFAVVILYIYQDYMKLIADSGSTKTDWCVVSGEGMEARVETQGINPFHQDGKTIEGIIGNELLPAIAMYVEDLDAVYFYGAGCTADKIPEMAGTLEKIFHNAEEVEVCGDLMAAARALFGNGRGVACILGTGSNSCLYDGSQIVSNIPPLGYVLGDEGSGAVLGRMFFNAVFKGKLPAEIRDLYLRETGYTYSDIINKVYREPLANRFLASVSGFIKAHIETFPQLKELVVCNFRTFFSRNIAEYDCKGMKISAVGSVAYYYGEELRKAAMAEGYEISDILKSPMEGLLRYHSLR